MLKHISRLSRGINIQSKGLFKYGELTFTQQLSPQKQLAKIPTYRVIDLDGKLLQSNFKYDGDYLSKILKTMIYVDQMDKVLFMVKAQGKISFYMTSFGQLACVVGSAAGLNPQDWIYTQYRQQGAFIWRGFTIDQVINQCIGNSKDGGKGRQMPVHYGAKEYNMVTLSSPLTTQVPQAVGTGYAFRTEKQNKIAVTYLGEGAASEGDFPTALNFAATLNSQVLFIVRNNKYAISTPANDQYYSDGIIPRAVSMGIASLRVDGNDTLACLEATTFARRYILQNKKPFFIQFMTYRIGDHSSSDKSIMYRSIEEINFWKQTNDPIKRLTNFLKSVGYKNIPNEASEREKARKQISDSLKRCEKHKYPSVLNLFDDVYDKLPKHLQKQRQQLKNHIEKYGDKYEGLDKFQS